MDKENPKVSVIICAYTMERLEDIHEAVNSVLAQTLKPYEVILAIDHNRELYQELAETYRDSIEICRNLADLNQSPDPQPPARIILVLNSGAHGLSETRNVGIHTSTADIIAFIDDDAVAEKDWLENLTKHFHDPGVVAVGGRAIPVWHNGKRPSWFPEELDWIVGCTYRGLPLKGNQIRNVPGCNMAFKKEVFGQAGYWGTEIGATGQSQKGGEEAELCLRIKHKMPGANIYYESNSIIYHKVPPERASLKWVFKNSFDQGICKAMVNRLSSNQDSLTTEVSYLRYLLFTAIPQRLKGFYKKGSLSQLGAIIISIAATGVGYVVGKLNLTRFLKYCAVGGLGALINEGLLWLLTSFLGIFYLYSALFSIEVAIVIGFNLHDRWTFGDRQHMAGNKFIRFLKFNLLIVGGVGLNLGILWVLTDVAGIYYLVSNLFGIAVAAIWNYNASTRWAWKKQVAS